MFLYVHVHACKAWLVFCLICYLCVFFIGSESLKHVSFYFSYSLYIYLYIFVKGRITTWFVFFSAS